MTNQPTVLVVDDDAQFLRALNVALTSEGYTVIAATNPGAALEYVVGGRHRFDLIITDVQMPGINGLHFLRVIKKHCPAVPVIVMTAYGGLDSFAEAMHEGAFAFLNKPFEAPLVVVFAFGVHRDDAAVERTNREFPRQIFLDCDMLLEMAIPAEVSHAKAARAEHRLQSILEQHRVQRQRIPVCRVVCHSDGHTPWAPADGPAE